MATIEADDRATQPTRVALAALGVLGAAGVTTLVLFLWPHPQLGANEEVFKTVDALYTAVRSRDEKRLALCEQHLAAHKAAGKLPRKAADYLDGVIAKARGGRWEPAARGLYDFMLAQRREGGPAEATTETAERKGNGSRGKNVKKATRQGQPNQGVGP